MNLTPEQVKAVADSVAKRKEEYRTARAKKPESQQVQVSKCKGCGIILGQPGGTIRYVPARTKEGRVVKVAIHENCPAGKP